MDVPIDGKSDSNVESKTKKKRLWRRSKRVLHKINMIDMENSKQNGVLYSLGLKASLLLMGYCTWCDVRFVQHLKRRLVLWFQGKTLCSSTMEREQQRRTCYCLV